MNDENKIQTSIPKTVITELLYLSTKQLHFTFNSDIYTQCDGPSLGPLSANLFMASLEEDLIPALKSSLS